MAAPIVKVFSSDVEVAEKLCAFVIESANKAISERNVFLVGVSGKCNESVMMSSYLSHTLKFYRSAL